MKSEYFLPGFHRAAAVKSDANGIFHVAASEMNWIGRLSQIVKLILTGWGCWHSSWLLLTHTHTQSQTAAGALVTVCSAFHTETNRHVCSHISHTLPSLGFRFMCFTRTTRITVVYSKDLFRKGRNTSIVLNAQCRVTVQEVVVRISLTHMRSHIRGQCPATRRAAKTRSCRNEWEERKGMWENEMEGGKIERETERERDGVLISHMTREREREAMRCTQPKWSKQRNKWVMNYE